jgi:uncharacterized membrane protein SpoIIM required for sporulation
VNERHFRGAAQADGKALERDLALLKDGGEVDALAFAARYRRLCQRLSVSQKRRYGADLVLWLNAIAQRGHVQLYRRASRHVLHDVVAMLAVSFPRALRKAYRSQLAALVLFLAPALFAFVTIRLSPSLVDHFLAPEEVASMEAMYDPASEHFLRERASGDDISMFGFYIYNNIGIAFRTFATGLLLGVGAAFSLAYNGIVLGSAAAHLVNVGSAGTFFPFVIGHGALELTAIVMSGGTGLALGFAVLAPGGTSRAEAIGRTARASLPILYGMTAMLLGAAFLEAFWSSRHSLGSATRYAVGAVLWALVLGFVLLGGRRRAA